VENVHKYICIDPVWISPVADFKHPVRPLPGPWTPVSPWHASSQGQSPAPVAGTDPFTHTSTHTHRRGHTDGHIILPSEGWLLSHLVSPAADPGLLSSAARPSHGHTLLQKGLSCSWSRPMALPDLKFPAAAGLERLVPPVANLQTPGLSTFTDIPVLAPWLLILLSG